MKKQALTLALLICSWMAMAQTSYPPYDFKVANVDGDTLYYRITSSSAPYTVAVTRCMDSAFHTLHVPHTAFDVGQPGYAYPLYNYDSLISIPSEVAHNGITYSVSAIDNEAFYFQWGIKKVILPATVTTIDTAAFYHSRVSEIVMPGVQQILYGAFCGTPLEQVELPPTLTWLGEAAFAFCSIRIVDIPCGVSVLQHSTFFKCPLEKIILHEGLEEIEEDAFGAEKMDSLIFPSTLKKLGRMLSDTYFPQIPEIQCHYVGFQEGNSPLELGDYCMYCFKKLRTLQLPNNLVSLGTSCFEMSGLDSLVIPEGVTILSNNCFAYCDSLKSVKLPQSLVNIDDGAFLSTSHLHVVTIPNQVLQIGLNVFECYENNTGLERVNMECVIPPAINNNSFPTHPIQFTIPCHTLASYQEAPIWSTQENFSFVEDCTWTEEYEKNPIEVYPNPNNGRFTVNRVQGTVDRVQVYDVYGKLLKTVEVNGNTVELDVRELASGMYFVRISTEKGVVTKSFVKK